LPRFPHAFEFRIALITAAALLIAQIGAVAHSYAHVGASGAATHQTAPGSHDACNDCLGFAPLLSAAGAPAALPHVEPQGRHVAARADGSSLVDRSLNLVFRSRAPPAAR
jgi:hypothetical protein